MYQEKLEKVGLNKNQAKIYSLLISTGGLKGSEITKEIKISRQLVYKTLDELEELSLIKKNEKINSPTIFEATHPINLEKLLHKKDEEIKKAKSELALVINNLTSDYNLISNQPGVQVFEGKEGVKKVLWDSLNTRSEILTYADVEPLITKIGKLNDEYVKERKKRKIEKRALVLDTEFARNYMGKNYEKNLTDTRFLKNEFALPFQSFVEIYDDKISYINFDNDQLIGIIIQNKSIADMNRYLFEFTWKNSEN